MRCATAADPILDRLAQVLAGEGDVVLAIAFGSVVAGNADAESDVDVAVWTDPALDHERKRDLTRAIALATGRPVDLVGLRSAGVVLRREIFCRGRKLVSTATRRCVRTSSSACWATSRTFCRTSSGFTGSGANDGRGDRGRHTRGVVAECAVVAGPSTAGTQAPG